MPANERKEALRQQWAATAAELSGTAGWGKAAEHLRRSSAYRRCDQLFVSPARQLSQVRINALVDGKSLIMPAPGLKDGFFLLTPFTIPFRDLAQAVSYKGVAKHGRLLRTEELRELAICLLVADAMAVDGHGGRLGDGKGFFDLACALLRQHGALAESFEVVAVVAAGQLTTAALPQEPWDVPVQQVVTEEGIAAITPRPEVAPAIHWQALTLDRTRRLTPLWKLYEQRKRQRS